ncbi:MAG TPA: DAK2 domain-containing protein [Acidimicrobiales bacterium]|jgi:DAK2 domain fusion protein YloV|nr:DAK2 domain-containing protein [Acidimicrobiales bacterium]
MGGYRDALRLHQADINRLNVYPVPDGDTGTNMALTLEAVVAELDTTPPPAGLPEVCKAIGHGSLMGARGNSGVILSQLLRGMSERMGTAGEDGVGPAALVDAMTHAAELARKAVVRPVEGTILTVASAAAEGAARAAAPSLLAVCESARTGAADALARTPEQLPVLARAGVVDAGGAGFVLLLDAFLLVLDGRPLPEPSGVAAPDLSALNGHASGNGDEGAAGAAGPEGETHSVGDLRYEVMYMLAAPDDSIEAFKDVWAGIGDSIVVVGGDGLWNCHIHTNDVGAAIEAALDSGRPSRIRVTDLEEQVEEERWVREGAGIVGAGPSTEGAGPPATTGVVAVVTGDGIGRIFHSLGVHHLVVGGQTMNPATADLVKAVELVASDEVVILPNNKNIRPVAEQVDGLSDKSVRVVATGSIVEGFAALLAYDPAADVETNAAAMTESAARVVPAEVTRAVRDSTTDVGEVHEGDWIGISRDGVVAIADNIVVCTRLLLSRLLDDSHELVTLIEGEGARVADTRRIEEWLSEEYPDVALEVHQGGQPLYPYLLGIE